ncbi:14814_t:CDS:2 [Funneliformis geosporum]|uniref:5-demethoxyubiquinone hydroxylase, mitochondrial n=1 Tax=Funneliformis geosporum TaxID=1117311 RepID=A0A9W4SH64_9GLOM|nr:13723_t:CDS:2 [Funneliformis geosporum]CAI2171480.1 14814_t:CDS:2 [Funneliformis geosporum]
MYTSSYLSHSSIGSTIHRKCIIAFKHKIPLLTLSYTHKHLSYKHPSYSSRLISSISKGINSNNNVQKKIPLTPKQKRLIDCMIRIDQAGEIGANYIYKGQLAILGSDKKVSPIIKEMWEQEKFHLKTFDEIIARFRVRPTILRPIWEAVGFIVGAGTAMMGKEAAMACTEAVETVIGQHYNDQLRELLSIDHEDIAELRKIIKEFRDDELQHLDTAVDFDAKKAPFHGPLTAIIHHGCKAAIWITGRL